MSVYLVGAGPGDPGLLTARGAEVLSRADVVLFDRLVSRGVVDLAPPRALRVDVGKRPGRTGPRRQAEINELLVEHGRSAETVVRLKGGDPFVFGRGGEEAEALRAAGIAFEVVPGVSSAFAVPASAGVPVTHRGLSRSVTVVTGHVGDVPAGGPRGPDDVDWEALARTRGTLVIMMGMQHRAEIARRLVAAGRPAKTPVLVVQHGTTPVERSVHCTLESLVDVELDAPSIIVVGEVAALDLRSGAAGPLSGTTVVVTRPRAQEGTLVSALSDAGARVVALPVVAIAVPADGGAALRAAAGRVAEGRYEWVVFTSANAVDRFLGFVRDRRDLARTRLAVVGGATAAALAAAGLEADLVPEVATAEGLAAAIPSAVPAAVPAASEGTRTGRGNDVRQDRDGREPGGRVLFPRAEKARDVLAPRLREKGWEVDEVEAYRTVAAGPGDGMGEDALAAASQADVVTFASPSAVRHYLEAAAERRVPPVVACIGPTTADAAVKAGLAVDVVAREQSADGLVRALVEHFSAHQGR